MKNMKNKNKKMHYNIKVYSTDILYRFIIVITIILLAKEILTGQCPCTGVLCFSLTVLTACSCCFFFTLYFTLRARSRVMLQGGPLPYST